jgi:hypothetical protein
MAAVFADCYNYTLIIFQLIVDTQWTHRGVPGSVRIWWYDLWYLRSLVSVNYDSLPAPGFSANRTKENRKHHKQKFIKTQLCSPSKHILHFQVIDQFLGVHFSNVRLLWILTSFDENFQVNMLVFAFSTWSNPLNVELNPICHLLALLGAHHILYVTRIRVNLHTVLKSAVLCIYDTVLHTKFSFIV